MFSAPFINLLIMIFTPLNAVFSLWKKLVSKLFQEPEEEKMSQEELIMLVEEVAEEVYQAIVHKYYPLFIRLEQTMSSLAGELPLF